MGWRFGAVLALSMLAGCQLSRSALGAADHDAGGTAADAGEAVDAASVEDSGESDAAVIEVDALQPDAARDVCGDGIVAPPETCDDHGTADGDGCSALCRQESGFHCMGSPSVCTTACGDGIRAGMEVCDGGPGCTACTGDTMQSVTRGPGLSVAIPDDTYDGSLDSMTCVDLVVTQFPLDHVASVQVELAMSHTWVGDLTIKLVSPTSTVVTMMSRPGRAEPNDDGSGMGGDGTDLLAANPITFVTAAGVSAENMGGTLAGGVVCRDDATCSFAPDHGAAATGDLTTFDGEPAHGTWRLCVGDGANNDTGSIDRVALKLTLR